MGKGSGNSEREALILSSKHSTEMLVDVEPVYQPLIERPRKKLLGLFERSPESFILPPLEKELTIPTVNFSPSHGLEVEARKGKVVVSEWHIFRPFPGTHLAKEIVRTQSFKEADTAAIADLTAEWKKEIDRNNQRIEGQLLLQKLSMQIDEVAKARFNTLAATLPAKDLGQGIRRYPYPTYQLRTYNGRERCDVLMVISKTTNREIMPSGTHDTPNSWWFEEHEFTGSESTPEELIEKARELEAIALAATLNSARKYEAYLADRQFKRERQREEQVLAEQTALVIKEQLNPSC